MNKVVAGMDLHSNNVMIGVMDMNGKRLPSRKVPCELSEVVKFMAPYKKRLERVAVESTYNWYWLVDGLKAEGYPVVLANPAKIDQYSGIKHADDKNDAFFLAELSRLKILPTGYVYDPLLRPVRDLLRRRMSLVHQRTSLMLSFKSLYQNVGIRRRSGRIHEMRNQERGQPCPRELNLMPGTRGHGCPRLRASPCCWCWRERGLQPASVPQRRA